MRSKLARDFICLALVSILSTLILWLPFLLHASSFDGLGTIKRNYDGLNYVIVAKSFYIPALTTSISPDLPAQYFAAQMPLYSVLIAALGTVIGDYLNAMLIITVFFSVTSAYAFYLLLRRLGWSNHALWLSCVFLFFPARWWIVRSVGAPEPIFETWMLLSVLCFINATSERTRSWLWFLGSGVFGGLAVVTRSPGILLLAGYGLYLLYETWQRKKIRPAAWPLALIPISLFGVFWWFSIAFNDFWAYFHSGDNIHLLFPPFQVFNSLQFWVGSIWLEDIIFYYAIYGLAIVTLWYKNLKALSFIGIVYFLAIISVAHRDIARYSLPLAPLAIIAFADLFSRKEVKIVAGLIIIASYFYAINFINGNVFPVASLAPYQ